MIRRVCCPGKGAITLAVWLVLLVGTAPVTRTASERLQAVYDLTVANGSGYTEAFYPATEATLYVLAGHPVAIAPRRTMVYYWATSGEWQPDWAALNEPLGITLEVRGRHTSLRLRRTTWVLSYQASSSAVSQNTPAELYTGQDAQQAYHAYLAASNAYTAALDRYNAATAAYKAAVGRFLNAVGRLMRRATSLEATARRLRAAGRPGSGALLARARLSRQAAKRLAIPREPAAPETPQLYVTAPSRDFVVTLPDGQYDLVARDSRGRIIAGTARQVVAFGPHRTAVGYTVIPAAKWTSPSTLDDPAAALYVAQRAMFYLQPFHEAAYNEYDYTKLADPQDDSGRPGAWTWAQTGPITTGTVRLETSTGSSVRARWRPYYVEQNPGSALGYTIVPFTPDVAPGQGPSLWAYRITVPASAGRLVLGAGSPAVAGAVRLVRPVRDPGMSAFAPALLPLLVGFALALVCERRRMRRHEALAR